KALDGDHIMIIILRIGLVAWIVAGFQDRLPADTASVQVHVLLLSLLVVLYSFIDMTFNTALGIGLMLSDLPGGITTALFFLFRGLGIMFVLWLFVQFVQRMYTLPGIAYFLPGLAGAVIYILITGLVLFVSQQIAVRNSLVSPSPRQ
ncbi:MAG TPA: hypothetical protein VHL11_21400, partial [Phototrophicaceae bacterium]|nr:hypothetical protein [Phototrophicaceae bacterium]